MVDFYKVFDYLNKDTWPSENNLVLLWNDGHVHPIIGIIKNGFFESTNGEILSLKSLNGSIYSLIGKRPVIEKEYFVHKCGDSENKYNCEYFDDGYCMAEDKICKYIERVKEYSIK